MRVIAGEAGGRKLKGPPAGVRPTSDLVRGALFDALAAQQVEWTRVLDLYAGSGALGIEALSRGGEWCDFVEQSAAAAAVIRENVESVGMAQRGKVHRCRAERAAERLREPYSLILADPPYDDRNAIETLSSIAASGLVAAGGTVVLEQSSRAAAPESLGGLEQYWNRRYGDTQISMYRRAA